MAFASLPDVETFIIHMFSQHAHLLKVYKSTVRQDDNFYVFMKDLFTYFRMYKDPEDKTQQSLQGSYHMFVAHVRTVLKLPREPRNREGAEIKILSDEHPADLVKATRSETGCNCVNRDQFDDADTDEPKRNKKVVLNPWSQSVVGSSQVGCAQESSLRQLSHSYDTIILPNMRSQVDDLLARRDHLITEISSLKSQDQQLTRDITVKGQVYTDLKRHTDGMEEEIKNKRQKIDAELSALQIEKDRIASERKVVSDMKQDILNIVQHAYRHP